MLTRRHIRVKVMQSLYSMEQTQSDNLGKEEKFLLFSIDQMYELFIINLQLLVEIRKHAVDFLAKSQKKHLATSEEKNPNTKFINKEVLLLFCHQLFLLCLTYQMLTLKVFSLSHEFHLNQ